MRDFIDSAASYLLGIAFVLYSGMLAHSEEIMTVGGIALLACRLYVDGGKAYSRWKDGRNGRK